MFEYKVFGICKAQWVTDTHICDCPYCEYSNEEMEEYPYLEDLIDCEVQDKFTDYFDHKEEYGLVDDETKFVYKDRNIFVETVYRGIRWLEEQERDELVSYTQGQWSDGIGESYEQWPQKVNGNEVYISMWYRGQRAKLAWRKIDE